MANAFGMTDPPFLNDFIVAYCSSDFSNSISLLYVGAIVSNCSDFSIYSYAALDISNWSEPCQYRNGNLVYQNISLLFLMLNACYYTLVGVFLI